MISCSAYRYLPEFVKALKLQERALEVLLHLGTEGPDVAADLDNLGLVYMFLGDYRKAAKLHEEALEEWGRTDERRPGEGPLLSRDCARMDRFALYCTAIDLYRGALERLGAMGETFGII